MRTHDIFIIEITLFVLYFLQLTFILVSNFELQISESFKSFGMRDSSTSVLAVTLHPDSDTSQVNTCRERARAAADSE